MTGSLPVGLRPAAAHVWARWQRCRPESLAGSGRYPVGVVRAMAGHSVRSGVPSLCGPSVDTWLDTESVDTWHDGATRQPGPAALPGPPGTGTSTTVASRGVTTVGSKTQFQVDASDTCAVNECEVRKSSRPFHDAAPTVTVCVPRRGWGCVDTQRRTRGRCRFVITGARMARCRQRVKPHVNRFHDVAGSRQHQIWHRLYPSLMDRIHS